MVNSTQDLEHRLTRWAQACTVGDGSGFATVNTLHPNWSPPTPGRAPSMKVTHGNGREIRATHQAISMLTIKQRDTVVARYCWPGSDVERAMRLGIPGATFASRLATAKAHLVRLLEPKKEFTEREK